MSKKVIKNNKSNFIPTAENLYTTKKGKLKWSFWVVLALMVFWSVGAVLGIFATARSCNDSASVKIVSAAEGDKKPLEGSIVYNGEKFSTYSFNGLGYNTITSQLQISFNYTLSSSNCVYIVSRTGKIPGEVWLYGDGRFIFSSFSSEDTSNSIEFYSLTGVNSTVRLLMNYDLNTGSSFYFDLTVIITSDLPFNPQVPVLYENGFLDSYCAPTVPLPSITDKDSLGFFQGGTFKASLRQPSTSEDYSSWSLLPDSLITGYYSGVLMSFYGDAIDEYVSDKPSSISSRYVVCDFGVNGKQLGGFSYFMVVLKQGNNFSSTGEYGSSVVFRFTDNSQLSFNTADDYFSFIDLSSYQSKRVRSVVWRVARGDIQFMGLTSNQSVIVGYNSGYNVGLNDGYGNGYSVGLSEGKTIGYNMGVTSANNYSFLGLFGAVVDAPITALSGLLNFDLLGFNMLNFFYALCTCALVIAVVRMIL